MITPIRGRKLSSYMNGDGEALRLKDDNPDKGTETIKNLNLDCTSSFVER